MKTAMFNRFTVQVPEQCAIDCSQSGDVSDCVDYWHDKVDLSHVSDADLIAELSEYGAWEDKELQDRHANERRIIWIASGNITEDSEE